MIFDKSHAMRNAERHVSQNKIRAAIEEYRQVVAHDPKDVVTLNMLGDLYAKDSNKAEAINCYKKVAESYGKQGFSQKAIAVYKKITKIDPNSVEISGKLAELYQNKGSVTEARSHFATLADHYLEQGRKTEALAIWKQIAILDPNDLEVYPKIGDAHAEEAQEDEAAKAYTESGGRFAKFNRNDEAIAQYIKALDIRPGFLPALNGFVALKTELGQSTEAAKTLEGLLEKEPYNRDLAALMVECFLGAGDLESAERGVIRLVEQEPANHPKLLDLVETYLSKDDLSGAARCLTLCIEHLLLGGKDREAEVWIDEILGRDETQLGALKLRVRYMSWRRDDKGLQTALIALDEASVAQGSLEDERYALSQLVMILPQELSYADRLRVINEQHGFTDNLYDEKVLQHQFDAQEEYYKEEVALGFDFVSDSMAMPVESVHALSAADLIERNGAVAASMVEEKPDISFAAQLETFAPPAVEEEKPVVAEAPASLDSTLEKELDSIKFYIDSGYSDLAVTALDDLVIAHGELPEISALRSTLKAKVPEPVAPAIEPKPPAPVVVVEPEPIAPVPAAQAEPVRAAVPKADSPAMFDLGDIREELGLDEPEVGGSDDDYETNYQMAVAYQEMGLMEDAIKGFQEAISQIGPNDTTRRFFHCANLLGHCFMQKGMAKLALKWYNRALETPNLNPDEKKGIWYELAEAHEVDGDHDNAARFFEQVYAEDVDFRDVGNRIQNLTVNA
ncbi:MAG: tetratricopeptide repeat protein [Acidobacteriota bacterium]